MMALNLFNLVNDLCPNDGNTASDDIQNAYLNSDVFEN